MKKSLYILFIMASLAISCQKEDSRADLFVGRWTGVITPSSNANGREIRFKQDGTLGGNAFPNFTSFFVKDNTVITFKNAATSVNYNYTFANNLLSLTPAGINCLVDCSISFQKSP